MDYHKMKKDELVKKLEALEQQLGDLKMKRAFTYEDQMKLLILDQSPFTIWASDSDCKITFWSGKCESFYGYTRDQVIGQDFVDLFVDEDEKIAARRDQKAIIDEDKVFHNIANDCSKEGRTLKLITNCRRIFDIKTGKPLNAEIGMLIDFLDDEYEKLKQAVSDSKKVHKAQENFSEAVLQEKKQLSLRKRSINMTIREYEREAIDKGLRERYLEKIEKTKETVKSIEAEVQSTAEEFIKRMKDANTCEECEEIRHEFEDELSERLDEYEEVTLDVIAIAKELGDNSGLTFAREQAMRMLQSKNAELSRDLEKIEWSVIEREEDYRGLGVDPDAELLKQLREKRKTLTTLSEKVGKITVDSFTNLMSKVKTEDQLKELMEKTEASYNSLRDSIEDIRKEVEREQ